LYWDEGQLRQRPHIFKCINTEYEIYCTVRENALNLAPEENIGRRSAEEMKFYNQDPQNVLAENDSNECHSRYLPTF
jgi:hypothetical protein